MKTRSPLTGDKHTAAEYEAAKLEPVELRHQVSADWKAPHFVWQVRHALGAIAVPRQPERLPAKSIPAATGSSTTLDWKMQKIAEKWVYAAARAPQLQEPAAILTSRKIPTGRPARGSSALRGHNINNAAAAVIDYRTGEVLAYVGSAELHVEGQQEVPAAVRRPGRRLAPAGIGDQADRLRRSASTTRPCTAATMFMDVTTNFGGGFIPTQADKLERGPVRLRSALQFSLNIPAIKATIMQRPRPHLRADQGLRPVATRRPAARSLSMGIGTLEVHPIDLLGAYGTIANGGVLMPRRVISTILDSDGKPVWPTAEGRAEGRRGSSARRRRLHRHRHPGRQHRQEGQPVLGQVGHLRRQDPPPGRVQDRHDERQPRRRGVRLRRAAEATRRRRPSPSASGWATATTHPTTASSRSTRPRRSGRRSSRKSARTADRQVQAAGRARRPPPSTRSPA